MITDEGSVLVDGVDATTETNDENTQEIKQPEQNLEVEKRDTSQQTEEKTEDTKQQENVELTDKGTKLASDPLSRANQLRANAEAKAREYERKLNEMYALLNNPQVLESYLKQFKKDEGVSEDYQPEEVDISRLNPDEIETVEDFKNFAKAVRDFTLNSITKLKQDYQSRVQNDLEVKTAERIQSRIAEAQNKYNELRKTNPDGTPNPDYDPEIDAMVSDLYIKLDFDRTKGFFRGNYDPVEVADYVMNVVKIGQKYGSKKAQTEVIDKRLGRVETGFAKTDVLTDDNNLSPAEVIARRLQRARRNR